MPELLSTPLIVLADYACTTGECPTWHPVEKVVYWTDIPNGKLYRYHPDTRRHEQVYSGRVVGGITVQADGKLLLFMDEGSVATWDGSNVEFLIDSIPEERGNRFNDVIADPEGRVFAGTMSNETTPGRLYRIDRDLTVTKVVEGTTTSNGMGFSPDRRTFYFTDTRPGEIYAYDYDRATGSISSKRLLMKLDRTVSGAPDGMTVDADGFIWSCRWDGARVVKVSPEGEELVQIDFPVKKVSSITFGGDDYQDAFVTTAGGQDPSENGELAGSLFKMRPGAQGVPEFFSRIGQ